MLTPKQRGTLTDVLHIVEWNALEARGEWSKELGGQWDALATLLAWALDKSEEEQREAERLKPAADLVRKAYGQD